MGIFFLSSKIHHNSEPYSLRLYVESTKDSTGHEDHEARISQYSLIWGKHQVKTLRTFVIIESHNVFLFVWFFLIKTQHGADFIRIQCICNYFTGSWLSVTEQSAVSTVPAHALSIRCFVTLRITSSLHAQFLQQFFFTLVTKSNL